MQWQFKYEPSAKAREFRWLRPYAIKFLKYSALAVAGITIGLECCEHVWMAQPRTYG